MPRPNLPIVLVALLAIPCAANPAKAEKVSEKLNGSSEVKEIASKCNKPLKVTFDAQLIEKVAKSDPPDSGCRYLLTSVRYMCADGRATSAQREVVQKVKEVRCTFREEAPQTYGNVTFADGVLTVEQGAIFRIKNEKSDILTVEAALTPPDPNGLTFAQAQRHSSGLASLKKGTDKMVGTDQVKKACGLELSIQFDPELVRQSSPTSSPEQGCRHVIGMVHYLCADQRATEKQKELSRKIKGVSCRFDPKAPTKGVLSLRNGVVHLDQQAVLHITNSREDVEAVERALR